MTPTALKRFDDSSVQDHLRHHHGAFLGRARRSNSLRTNGSNQYGSHQLPLGSLVKQRSKRTYTSRDVTYRRAITLFGTSRVIWLVSLALAGLPVRALAYLAKRPKARRHKTCKTHRNGSFQRCGRNPSRRSYRLSFVSSPPKSNLVVPAIRLSTAG